MHLSHLPTEFADHKEKMVLISLNQPNAKQLVIKCECGGEGKPQILFFSKSYHDEICGQLKDDEAGETASFYLFDKTETEATRVIAPCQKCVKIVYADIQLAIH